VPASEPSASFQSAVSALNLRVALGARFALDVLETEAQTRSMVSDMPNRAAAAPDMHMAGVAYTQIDLRPPFSVRAPLGDDWRLYLVRGGSVVFEADDLGRLRQTLPAGSVIAVSGVLGHRFGSVGDLPGAVHHTGWVERDLRAESEAGVVVITKGSIAQSRMPFVAPFEKIVVVDADRHPALAARFGRAIDWIVEEAAQPGREAAEITRRLAEITTLEIGRFEQSACGDDRSTAQAASDRRILRAISAFYAAPQEKWSVTRLADVAGMSRTAFAIRYRALIGTTPLRSLRQLRLQLAADELERSPGRPGVATIARRAGYGSGTTFIRAFASEFGTTPGRMTRCEGKARPGALPLDPAGDRGPQTPVHRSTGGKLTTG
jgi:AraC-like DNA-binding protein